LTTKASTACQILIISFYLQRSGGIERGAGCSSSQLTDWSSGVASHLIDLTAAVITASTVNASITIRQTRLSTVHRQICSLRQLTPDHYCKSYTGIPLFDVRRMT